MNVDEALRRRVWLLNNMDWFLIEASYCKEHKKDLNENRLVLWKLEEPEGKVKI